MNGEQLPSIKAKQQKDTKSAYRIWIAGISLEFFEFTFCVDFIPLYYTPFCLLWINPPVVCFLRNSTNIDSSLNSTRRKYYRKDNKRNNNNNDKNSSGDDDDDDNNKKQQTKKKRIPKKLKNAREIFRQKMEKCKTRDNIMLLGKKKLD